MAYAARESFLHEPNWIQWFYDAAFPAPSQFAGPNLGLDSPSMTMDPTTQNFLIGTNHTFSIENPGISTPDRRVAVHALTHEHPMLTTPPPSEYVWKKNNCAEKGTIDLNDYVDGIRRRVAPQREADLWFNPCPTNTYMGMGWMENKGFTPSRPEPHAQGCLPPLLYTDTY